MCGKLTRVLLNELPDERAKHTQPITERAVALDEALVLLGLIFKLIAYKSNMFAMSHSALSRCFPSSKATNLYKIAVPQITSINGTKLEI